MYIQVTMMKQWKGTWWNHNAPQHNLDVFYNECWFHRTLCRELWSPLLSISSIRRVTCRDISSACWVCPTFVPVPGAVSLWCQLGMYLHFIYVATFITWRVLDYHDRQMVRLYLRAVLLYSLAWSFKGLAIYARQRRRIKSDTAFWIAWYNL